MGVPKFFQALYELVGGEGKVTLSALKNINALIFDLPSLLHSIAQEVYAYGDNVSQKDREKQQIKSAEDLLEEYYKALFAEIMSIISEANPKLVAFFFDGVPVGGKIQQQRQRRFWAVQPHPASAPLVPNGPPEGPKLFDSNNITPGTPFMRELDKRMRQWIEESRKLLPQVVVFSSVYSPGEGEHKVMDFLREEIENGDRISDELGSTVIFGLDTDWLLLTLPLPLIKIYLWRKQPKGSKNLPFFSVGSAREILIRLLTASPGQRLSSGVPPTNKVRQRVIRDFVVFTFLLGNDFLPRSSTLENFRYTLSQLVEMYAEFQIPTEEVESRPLTTPKRIIWANTLQFIRRIAIREGEFIVKNTEVSTLDRGTALKTALRRKGNDFLLDYPLYKQLYYDHRYKMEVEYGGINSEKISRDDYPSELVYDYLTTMNYLFTYYRQGSEAVNKKFYYRFHYPPLFSDIIKLGAGVITEIVERKDWAAPGLGETGDNDFLHPARLLVAVLPRQSANLMPATVRDQVEEKIASTERWKKLFPKLVVKDSDGVIDPKHAPVIVSFFPIALAEKIKVPPKSPGNLEEGWDILIAQPRRQKKAQVSTGKGEEEEEFMF